MAALPDFGIDPSTQEPMEMPEDYQPAGYAEPGVDPGSPPADPMLQQEPDEDEYETGDEVEYRERVELCVLGAIERAAKAVEVGTGADNLQFAQAYAQACAALGQCYESLTRSEQSEKLAVDAFQAVQPPQSSPSTS